MSNPFAPLPRLEDRLSLRPREAARLLGISENTLRAYTKAGMIPCRRLNKAVLYSVDELRKWCAGEVAR